MSKDCTLYCRVSEDMRLRLKSEATRRGESESVIIREALRKYLQSPQDYTLNEVPINSPLASVPAPGSVGAAPAGTPHKSGTSAKYPLPLPRPGSTARRNPRAPRDPSRE